MKTPIAPSLSHLLNSNDYEEENYEEEDEENEEDEEEDEEDEDANAPLYPGSYITFKQSLILILCFYLKHNINQVCLTDLFLLLNLHFAPLNRLKKYSLYKFKKFFKCSIAENVLSKK